MKLTKKQLQELIMEELARLNEVELRRGMSPVEYFSAREKEMGTGPGDEGSGGDPLRDAVRDFVNAVKDLV